MVNVTPFRIQNAQRGPPFSLITAHKVGVLNEKRCKIEYDGKTEKFESRQVIDAMYLKDSTISYKFN